MTSNERILQELRNTFQKRVHTIRTSLSTVMNDLTYFSNQLGTSETRRPLEACRAISEGVDAISKIFPDIQLKQTPISEICPEIDCDRRIRIDQNAITAALQSLSEKIEIYYRDGALVFQASEIQLDHEHVTQSFFTLISHGEVLINENTLTLRIRCCDE